MEFFRKNYILVRYYFVFAHFFSFLIFYLQFWKEKYSFQEETPNL